MLIDRYELKDIAIKVVGVGSVGTHCAVMLLMASERDPLFLQVKGARRSVKDDPTTDPVFGRVGRQKIENTGPLTRKRMETFDVAANILTIDAIDPKSGTSEFKASAIRIEKLAAVQALSTG